MPSNTRRVHKQQENNVPEAFANIEQAYAELVERKQNIIEKISAGQRKGLETLFGQFSQEKVITAIIEAQRQNMSAKDQLRLGSIMHLLVSQDNDPEAFRVLAQMMKPFTNKLERWGSGANTLTINEYAQWLEDIALLRNEIEVYLDSLASESNERSETEKIRNKLEELQRFETTEAEIIPFRQE